MMMKMIFSMCVCGEKGTITTTKKWSFVFVLVSLLSLEFSLIIVVIVCVVVFCECILCNCSRLVRWAAHSTREWRPNQARQTWRKVVLFVFLFAVLLFFVRHFFHSRVCEPKSLLFCFMFHPLFCILFYFSLFMFCSRKNGVRFVCFCFVSASFFFSSSYFQSIF